MRRIILGLFAVLLTSISFAQVSSGDKMLDERLATYMQWNKQLNFEKLFEYIHPNIFKVAPKDQMIEAFKAAFDNEAMQMGIDTIEVKSVGEVFKSGAGSYRRIDYTMSMHLLFKDATIYETPDFEKAMLASFEKSFGDKIVSFDKASKTFRIRGGDVMYAIKDNAQTPWLFIGYEKNKDLIEAIFPKAVIEHFNLL
ncbi:MAG: hypothetical protein JWP69_1112 [Flaviaesturariibacter sp.]|nr:hypothetical protein [Flaviaesturariibacter sp.]